MSVDDFIKWDDNRLGDHFRGLILAYDEACLSYDREKASRIHREFYLIEDEMRRRRGEPDWRRSGLEDRPVDAVVARFVEVAQERAACDDPDELDRLYLALNVVKNELQRRSGDARRELFKLYTHPDINIRAAADATRNLALQLPRHRLRHVDEDDWLPPVDGLDIEQAGLEEIFVARSQKQDRLKSFSGEQLKERFVALILEDDDTLLEFNSVRGNQLYGLIEAVRDEFRGRPLSERRLLIDLYTHPNPHLRLQAAKATVDLEPEKARQVLDGTDMNEENKKPERLLRKVMASMRGSSSH